MIARSIVEGSDPKALRIFYSYARADCKDRDILDNNLASFKWDLLVGTWYDGNIPPGDPFDKAIHRNLISADVILLFVSNSFMESQYCQNIEVPLALKRHESGQARVIPIILEDTTRDWHEAAFGELQALPQNGVPISLWHNKQEAIRHVSQSIVNIIVQQGIKNRPRVKWKIVLRGDIQKFTSDKELAIIQFLREFTGDQTLRPLEVGPGNITMLMESTGDAIFRLLEARRNDKLTIPGWEILHVVELYGAGIQASAEPCTAQVSPGYHVSPCSDAILTLAPDSPAAVMTMLVVDGDGKSQFRMGFDDGIGPIPVPRLEPDLQARLIDYFFTGLAIRNEECWVNLGPDDRNRMIPEYLAGTQLGRVMLDQDFQLKRLCASLLHPDFEHGRNFWRNVFERAQSILGTTSLPYSTFFRVWVVPDNIVLIEGYDAERLAQGKGWVEIGEARLKILSEREYLGAYAKSATHHPNTVNDLCYAAFEETILPVINRQVSYGAHWVPLREAFNSLVLAQWFKARFGNLAFGKRFINTHKRVDITVPGAATTFTNLEIPENKEYFEKYMDVFKKGVFYTVRDDYDHHSHQKIARAYFAGAVDFRHLMISADSCRCSFFRSG